MALKQDGSDDGTGLNRSLPDPDFFSVNPPADPTDDLENAEITFPDPTNPDSIDPDIINPAVNDPDDDIDSEGEIDPKEDIDPLIDPEVPDREKPDSDLSHSGAGVQPAVFQVFY